MRNLRGMTKYFTQIKNRYSFSCPGVLAVAILALCFFQGCLPAPYYQKEEAIPQNAWKYSFKPTFTFEISDTVAAYQPYFIIQHTQAYPYSNIWMWVYIKTPGDTVAKKERVNVILAEQNGQWLGRGMGEIWEQRLRLNLGNTSFNRKGEYKISFEQNMRVNPLPEILHVGIRLEKEPPRR
jgi:gliding motility-associated lipoprotein GldH